MESLVLPQILHPSIFYRLFGLGSRRQQSNEYNTKECGITQGPHLGARPRVRAPMRAPGGRAFAHGAPAGLGHERTTWARPPWASVEVEGLDDRASETDPSCHRKNTKTM